MVFVFLYKKKFLSKNRLYSALILSAFIFTSGGYYLIKENFESYKNNLINNRVERYLKIKKEEKKNRFVEDWEHQINEKEKDNLFKTHITKFGGDNEKLKIQSPSIIKASAYYTMSNNDLIYGLKKLGFEEIVFTDGSDQNTWEFNLKELK